LVLSYFDIVFPYEDSSSGQQLNGRELPAELNPTTYAGCSGSRGP
jgi:hypothetical protein